MQANLIAGIGLTHLTVYDQRPAPDGIHSGCAHVHAVTDEAYYVISGSGAIELHDLEHGFRNLPLGPGDCVQFAPGTVHRSVSHDRLKVLAVMSNAGLAERGDARIWFGPAADGDPVLYEKLRGLVENGLEGALERRDHSVRAYQSLMRLWSEDRAGYRTELARFIDVHARAMVPLRERFQTVVAQGPSQWLASSLARIDSLPVQAGRVEATSIKSELSEKLGMCGLLRPLEIPSAV
jgi:mannose-6-phosphate isomerase-like protein (cupin superfamily)